MLGFLIQRPSRIVVFLINVEILRFFLLIHLPIPLPPNWVVGPKKDEKMVPMRYVSEDFKKFV